MDCNALVAASPDLPFDTMVVKIIDRGPEAWTHRVIDVSTGVGRGISLGWGRCRDADPLPLYVTPTVVPLVAPVVLVVLRTIRIIEGGHSRNRVQARVGHPLHRHR
jgi:hypothetical protein